MRHLGICAIAKNETPFLREWVAFHTLLGVEGFIIYDNASEIPIRQTLRPMMRDNLITVIDAPGRARQIPCYNHCLEQFGKDFAWLLFIDLDEFAVPKQVSDLRIMLMEFEPYAGFAANWMTFGTNGHKVRPDGLVIENYLLCMPDAANMNRHVKVFCRPDRVVRAYNPHMILPREGHRIVNTRHQLLSSAFSEPPSWSVCQINHYYYRSVQDYMLKLHRGMADNKNLHAIPQRPNPPHGHTEDLCAARCTPMVHKMLADEGRSCAALASRLTGNTPDTPEQALQTCAALLEQGDPDAALLLAAKTYRAFPGNQVAEVLFARMRELLPENKEKS